MKSLIIVALLISTQAFATNKVVSYQSEVVTSMNHYADSCLVNAGHHSDLVKSTAGKNVDYVLVSEPQYSSQHDMNDLVQKTHSLYDEDRGLVRAIVRAGIFAALGFNDFNQTRVQCVQVVKVGGKVVQRRVVRRNFVRGLLVGQRARFVRQQVVSCGF